MNWIVEHTDTFAGQANYCWRHTYSLQGEDLTQRTIVRRAKALCGLTGVRCAVANFGDMIEIRPAGMCQIVFVQWDNRPGVRSFEIRNTTTRRIVGRVDARSPAGALEAHANACGYQSFEQFTSVSPGALDLEATAVDDTTSASEVQS